jgi:hypothetical protein
MPTEDRGKRLGLSAAQVKGVLETAFDQWLKEMRQCSLDELLKGYQAWHGVSLPFNTLIECKYSLEFLSIHFPSNGCVGNNQFWKVVCCLLHEVGGRGVDEPERIEVYLNVDKRY